MPPSSPVETKRQDVCSELNWINKGSGGGGDCCGDNEAVASFVRGQEDGHIQFNHFRWLEKNCRQCGSC